MDFDLEMETHNHSYNKKFKWTITNVSKLIYNRDVKGPSFFPIPGYPFKWQFKLHYSTTVESEESFDERNCTDNIEIVLRSLNEENSVPSLNLTGWVCIKTMHAEAPFDIVFEAQDYNSCLKVSFEYGTIPKNINQTYLLPDDTMIIEWDMTISGILTSSINRVLGFDKAERDNDTRIDILKIVHKRKAFTDFSFHVAGKVIPVHKAIVSARSPVFQKMLEHNTLEKQTNYVDIEDVDLSVFGCFVEYLYTNEIDEVVTADLDALSSLYEIADKYEVPDLQRSCAKIFLSNFMGVCDVARILQVADLHHDVSLKKNAMQFIRSKISEVVSTPEWKNLLDVNVKLASEVLQLLGTSSGMNRKKGT